MKKTQTTSKNGTQMNNPSIPTKQTPPAPHAVTLVSMTAVEYNDEGYVTTSGVIPLKAFKDPEAAKAYAKDVLANFLVEDLESIAESVLSGNSSISAEYTYKLQQILGANGETWIERSDVFLPSSANGYFFFNGEVYLPAWRASIKKIAAKLSFEDALAVCDCMWVSTPVQLKQLDVVI